MGALRAASPPAAGVTSALLHIEPLTPAIGAEVRDLDITEPLDAPTVAAIRAAALEHSVLFFPGQRPDIEQHRAFARYFGEIAPSHPVLLNPLDDDHTDIYLLDTRQGGQDGADKKIGRASHWHADITYMRRPTSFAVLHVVEVPAVGGDTQWASGIAAYASLSQPLRDLADRLRAVHDINGSTRGQPTGRRTMADLLAAGAEGFWDGERFDRMVPSSHPVVRVHPETGRRGLFINPSLTTHIEGVSTHESEALLALFIEHLTRPEHVVRYRWTPGSVALWDNRSTVHLAVDDYGNSVRVAQRIHLYGDEPVGVS
jgi:alpha-ketoglutarate-dependent taurine dioxygenase